LTALDVSRAAPGVLLIVIDRPSNRNAVNREVAEGISSALDEFEADDVLRAAVLTGRGEHFCAGMDLTAFRVGERPHTADRGFAGIVRRPPTKPIIAAVEGYAVGGGLEIALACDVIVAGRSARLGLPEVRRGLIAAGGGIRRLPQRVSAGRAAEMLLTGDVVTADEGLPMGLVDRVVEDGEARPVAIELATRIARNAPLAIATTKHLLGQGRDWSEEDYWDRQEQLAVAVRASQDAREGAAAFIERRDPIWQGH
jgi:enoyl-CoA hydratase